MSLSKMEEGLKKLQAIAQETPPPVVEPDDDVPDYDVPAASAGVSHDVAASAPGATISLPQDPQEPPEGNVAPTGGTAAEEGATYHEPPDIGADGFVAWGDVETLRLWAEMHQQGTVFGLLTRGLPVIEGHPRLTPTQFENVREAILLAAQAQATEAVPV